MTMSQNWVSGLRHLASELFSRLRKNPVDWFGTEALSDGTGSFPTIKAKNVRNRIDGIASISYQIIPLTYDGEKVQSIRHSARSGSVWVELVVKNTVLILPIFDVFIVS